MQEFQLDCQLSKVTFLDEKNRLLWKLKLNDEWTILFVVAHEGVWNISSLEIHRENTAEEFLVSGRLEFRCQNRIQKGPINFSQFMKTETSSTVICSYVNLLIGNSEIYNLQGLVSISAVSEKPATSSANEESKEKMLLKSLEQLSNDFEKLLQTNSSSFADATLKCGSASMPAHKNILSARSPVFEAMFVNPMKESHKNEVDIADIEISTLQALLVYLYTGKTPDLTSSSAEDLLFAADKYQLQDLKTVCSSFLKDTVTLQSVLRILVLGDLHDQNLKSFAMDYICNMCTKFSVLEKTEEWNVMRKDRPALAMDVLTSLVKSKEEKMKK